MSMSRGHWRIDRACAGGESLHSTQHAHARQVSPTVGVLCGGVGTRSTETKRKPSAAGPAHRSSPRGQPVRPEKTILVFTLSSSRPSLFHPLIAGVTVSVPFGSQLSLKIEQRPAKHCSFA